MMMMMIVIQGFDKATQTVSKVRGICTKVMKAVPAGP